MQIIGSVQSHIKIIFFEMSKAMSCLANRTINYESFKNTGTPPLTQFFGPQKKPLKGKPNYRRSKLVLKWGDRIF